MKPILCSLGVFALLLLAAPAVAIDATPNTASIHATGDDCGEDLGQLLAATNGGVCTEASVNLIELAIAPHCCSQLQVDACRQGCRQQPGCKGVIGCRAGECVCTCDCH